jgi:hypothetical protein
MLKRITTTVALCLAVWGCIDVPQHESTISAPLQDPVEPGSDSGQTLAPVCKTVSLRGKVFYNDLRDVGLFADRMTIVPGVAGHANPWTPSTTPYNYLGLLDAKISIFEVDLARAAAPCAATEFVGSTSIAADGSWSWTGEVCDACRTDVDGSNDNGVSIAANIILENCTAPSRRCFSVDDPVPEANNGSTDHFDDLWSGKVWSKWYANANNVVPRAIQTNATVDLSVEFFQSTLYNPAAPPPITDMAAQASNVFASMSDVTRRLHLDEGMPFSKSKWGQIRAYFPSPRGGSAHSHQADRLCVAKPEGTWVTGTPTIHEYGHLNHYWAWGGTGKWGSFCFDSNGDGIVKRQNAQMTVPENELECTEDLAKRKLEITALKEAWAIFIERVTLAQTQHNCASLESQQPPAINFPLANGSVLCSGPTCLQSEQFTYAVERALCDLWDPINPNAPFMVGPHDALALSLTTLRSNLHQVWLDSSEAEKNELRQATKFDPLNGPTATAPLGLCRFARSLVTSGIPQQDVFTTLASSGAACTW